MNLFFVALHSYLRWALLVLLVINIVQWLLNTPNRKWGIGLLIITHTNFLIALYLYFFGSKGLQIVQNGHYTMKEVMKTTALRFWIVEHPFMMLLAIVLITVANSFSKKQIENGRKKSIMLSLLLVALIIILAAVPWPFRNIGEQNIPWFRGF